MPYQVERISPHDHRQPYQKPPTLLVRTLRFPQKKKKKKAQIDAQHS